jgi:hypothetical protein
MRRWCGGQLRSSHQGWAWAGKTPWRQILLRCGEGAIGKPRVGHPLRIVSRNSRNIFGGEFTVDAFTRTDLVFPLSGHNLSVGARNLNAGVHASLVVSLDDVTAVHAPCADTTVIWALRTGETALRPAVWPSIRSQKGVFLLQTEPDLVLGICFHQTRSIMTVVEFVGCPIGVPGLAHHQNVLAETDGIRVHGHGPDVDIGIVARSLAGRGAVEIPLGEVVNALGSLAQGLGDVKLANEFLRVIVISMCQNADGAVGDGFG